MKKILIALMSVVFFSGAAHAGTQQEKMKACNKDAAEKQLKGDERKAFMKECLSAKAPEKPAEAAAPAEPVKQQDKMKSCNKDAGDKQLKGAERKKFMSECLKK